MKTAKSVGHWSVLFVLGASCLLSAQEKKSEPQDAQKSCRVFVQQFYDWYVSETHKENAMHSWDLALKQKGYAFSPELRRELTEDSDAQAKAGGEIVGLDFDPFLNSQDPDERYVVGAITFKGTSFWVEVHSIQSGTKSKKPVVVPELVSKGGRWLFVNFHYGRTNRPEHENLLSILKSLKERRQNAPK